MGGLTIRPERESDHEAIRAVHKAAFGRAAEADLVERLRSGCPGYLGFVAEDHGEIVAHLAFTPVTVDDVENHPMVGLAPVGVLPDRQGSGVGSKLIREGLIAVRDAGTEAVVVLGEPDYYVRFGFAPAIELGLECEFDVPPDTFQALELGAGALAGVEGKVRYHDAFGEL